MRAVNQNDPYAACGINVGYLPINLVGYFYPSPIIFGAYFGGTITISEFCYNANGVYIYDGGTGDNSLCHPWLMHTLTHEIGHFVGLGHPREQNPLCNDHCVMYDLYELNSVYHPDAQRLHYVSKHDEKALINKWGG